MNLDLPDEARQFGESVEHALAAAGIRPGQPAEAAAARDLCGATLTKLDVWDLDPLEDETSFAAAAAVARAAGGCAAPYPVVERLARLRVDGADATALVARADPVAALGGDDLRWSALSTDGSAGEVAAVHRLPGGLLGDELHRIECTQWTPAPPGSLTAHLVLAAWFQLGLLDAAVRLTRRHVLERVQFGKPLAHLQTVQFRLAETVTTVQGVEELARYAVWSGATGGPRATTDAIGLRLAALQATETVFRAAHQLHGATGFCDEHELSWLSRRSLPFRHYPLNAAATRAWLLAAVTSTGFDGLFDPATAAAWGAPT